MANANAAQNLDDEARSRGGSNSGGNFKNDPQRAAEEGRKGGRASHKGVNQNQEMEDSDILTDDTMQDRADGVVYSFIHTQNKPPRRVV